MPTSKRDRYLRRARRLASSVGDKPKRQPTDRQTAIQAASSEKHKRLIELAGKYEPKIADLVQEYAEKRREVLADYEERKQLIRQATILEA